MIIRKLVRAYSEEHGYDGWLPLHRKDDPDFAPASGYGVAHDILEHEVDKIGGAEGEFMALGALCWIRGESGHLMSKSYFYRSIADMLASDFSQILSKIANTEQTLKDPGRVYKLRDWDCWNVEIDSIVLAGIEEFKNTGLDNYGGRLEDIPYSFEEIKRRIVGWMRKGFRNAYQFYRTRHGMDSFAVCHVFDQITKIVEKNFCYEVGDILAIRIDMRSYDVTSVHTSIW